MAEHVRSWNVASGDTAPPLDAAAGPPVDHTDERRVPIGGHALQPLGQTHEALIQGSQQAGAILETLCVTLRS